MSDKTDSFDRHVKWALGIAVALWAGVSILLLVALVRDSLAGASLASSKDLISPVVAATGMTVAVLAFVRDRRKLARDKEEATSKVMYEQATASLQQAFDLLSDRNQDRATWVRAGRLISGATQLSESITSENYQTAYRLASERIRHSFYDLFTPRKEDGKRHPLPAAFFFGLEGWEESQHTLDQLAVATAGSMSAFFVDPARPPPDTSHGLAVASVIAVMNFVRVVEIRDDPLRTADSIKWQEWIEPYGPAQGAHAFLTHANRYLAVNDKLYDRESRTWIDVEPYVPNSDANESGK